MILTKNLIAKELLTTFTVLKVHHEPHAESTWTLQFENYPPIDYYDKYLQTQAKDENLINKQIKAQIHLEVDYSDITLIIDPAEKKKSLTYVSTGSVIATGIYKDDIKDVKYEGIDSCLDSIFYLKITTDFGKLNLKKGDWIKVKTSESCIDIAREYTPLLNQEKKIEEVKFPKLKYLDEKQKLEEEQSKEDNGQKI